LRQIWTVAVLGKLGGTCIAARASGIAWRDAGALGILMNTRGLMELVILNVGLEIGVRSSSLFTMMVIMAVVTTINLGVRRAMTRRGNTARCPPINFGTRCHRHRR
jgi:Kef-type K+ transport system membrane component KefB